LINGDDTCLSNDDRRRKGDGTLQQQTIGSR
jgi:hypothetical protein